MNRVTSALKICISVGLIYTCTAQSGPRNILLTPVIYVASEGNSVAIQFTCRTPLPAPIAFLVDGGTIDTTLQETRGISMDTLNTTVAVLYILPLLVNRNTSVVCYDIVDRMSSFSIDGTLLVQGRLSAPPALTIMNSTSPSSLLLSWSPPFTLDLTDQEPDIIGYRVCFNLSFLHCVFTQDISYTYPNVRLPLQFSVTPLNVVGDGNSSVATHQPCTAAPDFMTVDELMLQVSLSTGGNFSVNASFTLPPQTTCYDAYQLVLANSSSSSSSVVSPILLPSVTDQDTQMVQAVHEFANLAENTIYSVSLLASNTNGQKRVTENDFLISTYDVQEVSLNEEGPGSMKLTCVFLANSAAQGCRLTLCNLEGGGGAVSPSCREVDLTRGSPIIILKGLMKGLYMVTQVAEVEQNGDLSVISDLMPLALQQVDLREGQPATSSSTSTSSTSSTPPPYSKGSDEEQNPTSQSNISIIIGPVGAAVVLIILFVLALALIAVYFYKRKKRLYSLKDGRPNTTHVRTLMDYEDIDGSRTSQNKVNTAVTMATNTGTQQENEPQVVMNLGVEMCPTPPPTSPLCNIQHGGKQGQLPPNSAKMTPQGSRDSLFKYSEDSPTVLPPPTGWDWSVDNPPQEDTHLQLPEDRHSVSTDVDKVDLAAASGPTQQSHLPQDSQKYCMPPTYAEVCLTTPKSKTKPRDNTSVMYSELRLDDNPPDVPNRTYRKTGRGQNKSSIIQNGGVKVEEIENAEIDDRIIV